MGDGTIAAICLDETDPLDCSQNWKILDNEGNFTVDTMMTTNDCGYDGYMAECEFPYTDEPSSTLEIASTEEGEDGLYYSVCVDGRDSDARYEEIGADDVTYCPDEYINGYWAYYTEIESGVVYMYYEDAIDVDGITGEGYVIKIQEYN